MSGCIWTPSEDGLDKLTRKERHQEALNLYVQPEPSPELEERLLRDSTSLQHNDQLTARNADASPQRVARTGVQIIHEKNGTTDERYVSSQAAFGDMGGVFMTDSPPKAPSEVPRAVVPGPDDRCALGVSVHLLEPQPTWPVEQPTAAATDTSDGCHCMPEGRASALQAEAIIEPMQAECGPCRGPPASTHPGEAAAGGELFSVHSLSLSGPDGDLLDQLLGPEAGSGSPPLLTPSSFLTAGPFGDAAIQPALSDYSQRPTPAHLADLWYAEAESSGAKDDMQHGQRLLPSAYSEPLPFSAAVPHHLALHPVRALGNASAALGKLNTSRPSDGGVQAATGLAESSQNALDQGPLAHSCPPALSHAPSGGGTATASADAKRQEAQAPQPQPQSQQPHQQAQSATLRPISRPMDEPRLATARSTPVPDVREGPDQAGPPSGPPTCGGVSSPRRVDERAGSLSVGSLTGEGAAAVSAGSALGTGQAAERTAMEAGEEAAAAVMAQQSPVDSRGKRPRQQPHEELRTEAAPPAASAPPNPLPPPSGYAAGPAGAAGAGARPNSPAERCQSAGDPMSVSGLDGGAMYGHGPPYPYPYGMASSYGMPYGMPYGDPYYHPVYGYPHMMDVPPPHGSSTSTLPGYCEPVPEHPGAGSLDAPAPRMLHYPGYMAPRHRLYRRFITGMHGRRDAAGHPPDVFPAGAATAGQDGGLVSMASAPAGSISTSTARGAATIGRVPSTVASTGPPSHPPAPAGGSSGGGATGPAKSAPPAAAAAAAAPSIGGAASCRNAPGWKPDMDAVLESSQAARACHAQFLADDMPLPLPRSTVDGIRQELRVVTQELLHRRMEEARAQKRLASASEGMQSRLQPANSWAPGDAYPALQARSAPVAASAQQQTKQKPACTQAGQPAATALDTHSGALAASTLSYPAHGGATNTTLPHKRTASSGPTTGAGLSPVRTRPAPSAPTGHLSQAPGPVQQAGLLRPNGGCTDLPMADPAAKPTAAGLPAPAASAPVRLNQHGHGVAPHGGGPIAMRQLFPPPGGGSFHAGPPMCGPGPASQPAPAGAGKPPVVAVTAASAPPGPRPAMSGKSAASATHSASVAQVPGPPPGAVQPQLQQKGGAAMPMGSYRVGQQGSMAADAEDDGEEVHGPPQRSSSNRPAAPPAGVTSGGAPAAAPGGQPPLAPGYYGAAMAPSAYEYPPGYYYPPPMGTYGMRMYGMPPPGMPSANPGYRVAPSGASLPVYGMPPPNMPYGMSGATWGEYGANSVPHASGMPSGTAGIAPAGHIRGSAAGA